MHMYRDLVGIQTIATKSYTYISLLRIHSYMYVHTRNYLHNNTTTQNNLQLFKGKHNL